MQYNEALNNSFRYCQEITKRNSNFYLGILFTAKEQRKAIYSVYAWLRAVDDITDDANVDLLLKTNRLQQYHDKTLAVVNGRMDLAHLQSMEPFWLAFKDTVDKYQIPLSYFEDMFKGQQQDLIKHNYKNFSELYQYCYLVAVMVGKTCAKIWGYPESSQFYQVATWSGVALQLTNILRDMQEDISLDRVYIPAEFVDRETFEAKDFAGIPHDVLMSGIKKLIDKTDMYFAKTMNLYLHSQIDRQLTFLIFIYYYKALFEKIRADPEIIFSGKKLKLSKIAKLQLILDALFNHFFTKTG
jgi:15-cis-phytoene synthase